MEQNKHSICKLKKLTRLMSEAKNEGKEFIFGD